MKSLPKFVYPNNFYVTQNRSQATYSTTPPGEPDINRALSGDARYWRRNEQKVRSPKKLIISDWPQYQASYQFYRCQSVVLQLIRDGFEVFYYDGHDIQPLTLSNLDKIKSIDKDLDSGKNIISRAAQKNWSAESILIIDDNLLRAIESHDFIAKNVLYVSSLLNLSEEDGTLLIAEKPDAVLIEDYYPHNINFEPKHFLQIKNRKSSYTYMVMSLEEYFDQLDDEHSLLHKNWNNLKQLEITVNEEIAPWYDRPLTLPSGLKVFKIQGNDPTDSQLKFLNDELPKLENLSLTNVFIDDTSLTKLLKSSSDTLRTLKLDNISGWNLDMIFDLQLPMLIKFLYGGDLNGNTLFQLLFIAPSLRSMHLKDAIDVISDNEVVHELPKLPLTELMLEDVNIDSNVLFALLRNTPALTSLTFANGGYISGELAESQKASPISLPAISKIDLFLVTVSADTFSSLLQGMPNLKKLSLGGVECQIPIDVIIENKLPLTEIAWNSSDITVDELCELLDELPSIKTIKITDCSNITRYTNNDDGYLSNPDSGSESEEGASRCYPEIEKVVVSDIESDSNGLTYNMKLHLLRNNLELLFPNAQLVMPKPHNLFPATDFDQAHDAVDQSPNMLSFDLAEQHDKKPEISIPPYNLATRDQNMVIGRLARYLKVSGVLPEQQELLRSLIQGICTAMSAYFKLHGKDSTDNLLDQLLAWDGDLDTLDEPKQQALQQILELYVAVCKVISLQPYEYYLGDNLELFLEHVKENQRITLVNNAHMVALERISSEFWSLYDPNCSAGIREIAHGELASLLRHELGALLALQSTDWDEIVYFYKQLSQYHAIGNFNEFIAQGGLNFLHHTVNHNELAKSQTPLTDKARQGFFLRNANYTPLWLYALSNPANPASAHWILEQLYQFIKNNPHTYAQTISHSVSESIQEAMDTVEQLTKSPAKYGLTLDAHGESIVLEEEFCSPEEHTLDTHFREFYQKLHDAIFSIPYVLEEPPSLKELPPIRGPVVLPHIETDSKPETQMVTESVTDMVVDEMEHGIETIQDDDPASSRAESNDVRENPYFKKLKNSKKTALVTKSLDEYCRQIEKNKVTNRLIALNTQHDLKRFKFHVVRHFDKTSSPVFVITQPSDANYRLPWVHYEGNKVSVRNETGGLFYDFLAKHQDTAATIIIDFSSMTTEEIISTINLFKNGLLKLPEQCQLIGLTLDGTQTQDYMSFFTNKEQYSMPSVLSDDVMDIEEENPSVIKLFQRNDWKSYLFGTLIPAADGMEYKQGKLTKALEKGRTVILEDAPLGDSEFNSFWLEYTNSGIIYLNQLHKLMPSQNIRFRESQNIEVSPTTEVNSSVRETIICNPGLAYKLFPHYSVKGNTLSYTKGKLATTSAKEIHLHLTRPLSKEQLDRALYVAAKKNIKLTFSNANTQEHRPSRHDQVPVTLFKSSDQDAVIAVLKRKTAGELLVLDVSELELSELVHYVEVLPGEGLFGSIRKRDGVVLDALTKGQTVILSGIFTDAVADGLAPLITKLETTSKLPGRLILVPQDSEPFEYVKNHLSLELSLRQKLALLPQSKHVRRLNSSEYESLSLPQLRAMLRAMEQGSVDPWRGIRELTLNYDDFHMDIDFYDTAAERAEQFHEKRITAVQRALLNEPYVLLTGLTGVGKTSFVEEYARAGNYTLYYGLDSLKEYAKDSEHRDDKPKLVFVDESNLLASDYTVFEGLYQSPPFIIVDGKKIPWGPNDKLIGAMNPLSYGDERSLSRFFERHGQAIVFEPLSLAFIYQNVLKPIFTQANIDMDAQHAICTPILQFYADLCRISRTEVLISPRELQMIALLTIANAQDKDLSDTVHHFIWQVGRGLIPKTHLKHFEEHYGASEQANYSNQLLNDSYLITSSRWPVVNQLQELTNLWSYKQKNTVRFAGLGGFILEGEPGIGKYELVKAHLLKNQLPFYEITLEMSLAEKERILLRAFDEGAFVLIRHINCAPMMERLLNCLLMGKTPEGEEAQKPGFFVIGTQNPITLPGRRAASDAAKRRIMTVSLPTYPAAEFHDVLKTTGVSNKEASLLLDAYQIMQSEVSPADVLKLTFFAPESRAIKRKGEEIDNPRQSKRSKFKAYVD